MPTYLYRCRTCGAEETLTGTAADCARDEIGECLACYDDARVELTGSHPSVETVPLMKRVWSIQFAPVMQEHFNLAVGQPISDRRQMDRALRQASDEATERTGIPHNYVQVDGSEAKQAAGIDDDMQREIANAHRTGRPLRKSIRDPGRMSEFASADERKKHLETIQREGRGQSARR